MILNGRSGHPAWKVLTKYRFAHRGYHDKPQIPENSLPAFRRALARGWGAELDVHLLRDGTLAVFHDSTLERCTGVLGYIEDLDLAGLRELRLEGTDELVPLFDEVLGLFEGKAPLIIELKPLRGNHKALAEAVCERLDRYHGDFCIESFDPRAVAAVKKLRPDICRGQLAQDFFAYKEETKVGQSYPKIMTKALTDLWFNIIARPDFIAYRFEDRANKSNQKCIHKYGLQGVNWTIRCKEDLQAAEREGSIPIFECFDPDK